MYSSAPPYGPLETIYGHGFVATASDGVHFEDVAAFNAEYQHVGWFKYSQHVVLFFLYQYLPSYFILSFLSFFLSFLSFFKKLLLSKNGASIDSARTYLPVKKQPRNIFRGIAKISDYCGLYFDGDVNCT